jgi:thiamine pyrophosphokinase
VDDRFESLLVRRVERFEARLGTVVSLIAPAGASGVTTRGLRWPLEDAPLEFSTLGIHNEVVESPVEVRVDRGPLFLLRGRFVEPHA